MKKTQVERLLAYVTGMVNQQLLLAVCGKSNRTSYVRNVLIVLTACVVGTGFRVRCSAICHRKRECERSTRCGRSGGWWIVRWARCRRVESNTAYDQCSDSNNLKLQRSRSAASSLRRRFGNISSRRESYRADPELLQRFGRLFSPPDVRSIISGCGSHARQVCVSSTHAAVDSTFTREASRPA